jgi:hypothetical protein
MAPSIIFILLRIFARPMPAPAGDVAGAGVKPMPLSFTVMVRRVLCISTIVFSPFYNRVLYLLCIPPALTYPIAYYKKMGTGAAFNLGGFFSYTAHRCVSYFVFLLLRIFYKFGRNDR